MIILKRSLFSTIKGSEKYKDEDFDNMTRGQKLKLLVNESALVSPRNIEINSALKGGLVGTLIAGVPSTIAFRNIKGGLKSGLAAGILGGSIGTYIGSSIGKRIAKKKKHDIDEKTLILARRLDEHARKNNLDDGFETRVQNEIKARKAIENYNSNHFVIY